ncbi:helix-turn-helix domain-containing protein [Paenibacillus sp. J2TS4]|uniref:helix-turn-helix domain-containing protein n=1 Tax=Paenibacillus sp. J2TS4 TaxID=2807194 RepID=UPI001B0FCEBA|nr:helix-turn-helix domain-containing protein [Paenibacillus sp. J2TS4]GIP32747.1 hypothetical protein J2TS4_19570 [Paenibacillus sp. J2TS4]
MKKMFAFLAAISFKRKLVVYSLLISILPVFLIGLTSSYLVSATIQEEVDHNQQIVLKQIQNQLNDFIINLNISSISLASNLLLEKTVTEGTTVDNLNQMLEMIETIRKQKSFSPIHFDVSVISKRYHNVYTDSEGTAFEFYNQMITNERPQYNSSFIVTPRTYPNQDDLLLFRPTPLHTYYTDGVVILHVSIRELLRFVENLNLGDNRSLYIIDPAGKIIISQNEEEIGTTVTRSAGLYEWWKQPSDGAEFVLEGETYQVSSQKSNLNNWTYISLIKKAELTRKADSIRRMTWITMGVMVLLSILVALVGSRKLYRPIGKLMDKISNEEKWETEHKDELQALDSFMLHMVRTNGELQDKLKRQIPDLKAGVFQQLLWGDMSEAEMRAKVEPLDLPLKGPLFYVCIAAVDEYKEWISMYRDKELSLIQYALKKVTEETFHDRLPCIAFTPSQGQVVIVIGTDKAGEDKDAIIRERADQVRHNVTLYFPFSVSVTISRSRKDYSSITRSYQEALSLLNYRLLLGNNVTISDNQIEPSLRTSSRHIFHLQKQIVHAVVQSDLEGAKRELRQLVEAIPQYAQTSETVLGLFSYLLGELYYVLHEIRDDLQEIFNDQLYNSLYGLTTLAEVEEWLDSHVFPSIVQLMESQTVSKQKKIVQQVLLFIHESFDSDLSLQQAADTFQLSSSQLSRIFKEETGCNFSEYLIGYRMKKASEWLEYSDMSIKEIADRLRYTNVQNFSRTFKQIIGVPPGEFRKQARSVG